MVPLYTTVAAPDVAFAEARQESRPPMVGLEPCPAADPASTAAVATALRDYLELWLGAGALTFREGPEEVPHGWETYIYRFRLRGDGLPRSYDRRLVLRIYASPQGIPRARHEFAAQRALFRAGYPVPEPLLVEEDCGLFGGPFLIMECLPGATLLDYLRGHNTHILCVAGQLADEQVRLHQLPVEGFPAPPGPFLERQLDALRGLVRDYGLEGLTAGLVWLRVHRPDEPAAPRVLHLDYHPVNVMVHDGRPPAVLDWSEADVGDRHADVATTVLLMQTAPVHDTSLRERLLVPATRWVMIHWYLHVYDRRLGLDLRLLRYYLAWTALRRLAIGGMWLRAGPQSNGCKPSAVRHLQTGYVERLQDCFRRWTGVGAHIV
jgi:aminoglycoside phosphotransferase (APT) family kinase protein